MPLCRGAWLTVPLSSNANCCTRRHDKLQIQREIARPLLSLDGQISSGSGRFRSVRAKSRTFRLSITVQARGAVGRSAKQIRRPHAAAAPEEIFIEHLAARPQWSRLRTKNRWVMLRPLCATSGREQMQQNTPRGILPCTYSITSSAMASRPAGIVMPSVVAVLRLITNSNLVGSCTGSSAGFSPLRMRSA